MSLFGLSVQMRHSFHQRYICFHAEPAAHALVLSNSVR